MFFKLNLSKFYPIYFSRFSRLFESLPLINMSCNFSLYPSSTFHSLAFTFDFSLFLIPQIEFVAKLAFFHIRLIKKLKLFLDNPTLKLLVSRPILFRSNYCNSVLWTPRDHATPSHQSF